MAIAAVSEVETRLCGNCKKDIPAVNFIIHEIHCSRNIEVCRYCSDSVPKAEMKNHIEAEHVQVVCKCRMKMENGLLKDHEASACPLRPALCQFCDIPLTASKLQEHELYCGARTEPCGRCGHNVLRKELKEHPGVCGQGRGRRAGPGLEDGGGDSGAFPRVGTQLRAEEDEVEQLGSRGNTHPPLYDECNTDLDYVLALSLQNQWDPPRNTAAEGPGDWWGSPCSTELVPFTHLRGTDKTNTSSCGSSGSYSTSNLLKSKCGKAGDKTIMLPCEFCEELYPAEDLILHQTGCNPASAFASFSKRSSSPNLRAYGGLRAVGSRSWRTFSASQPRGVQAEEDIMIPCEFCGIQLEEETLFHHQHHCDLRPASPADGFSPPQPQGHRRHSPEVTRRQLRHQGDVCPWGAEGFGQQRPGCPGRGTKPLNNVASARKVALGSAARASDPQGKPWRAAGNEGRPKNRGAGGSTAGATPRARPAQNFHPETFTPSFSRPPTQPSASSSGGRSLARADGPGGFRRRSTKAKAHSPGSTPAQEQGSSP